MLYSNFKYNNAFFPRAVVEQVGNLVRWQGKLLYRFFFWHYSYSPEKTLKK